MTTEEKAKAYDEALEKAQCWLNDPQTIQDCNYTIEDAIKNIFPVKESEDEKARKWIYDFIRNCTNESFEFYGGVGKQAVLAYLEKLKEANKAIEAVERIDKYIDENVANAHDMKDSNPDKKYYRGWDDALGEMARILQDVYSGEKQKEQKPCWNPTEEDVTLFNKAITTNASLSPQERAKLDILRMKFKHRPVIEQKEQKPDSLIYDKDLDKAAREFYLSGGADSPIDSTGLVPIVRMAEFGATWMKERMEKEQKPINLDLDTLVIELEETIGTSPHSRETIKEFFLKATQKYVNALRKTNKEIGELIEENFYLKEQQPAEWSEEDEEMIANIISSLHGYMCAISGNKNYNNHETYIQKEIEFLNALRPSWKPSKEQMKALKNSAYGIYQNGDGPVLRGLYEQLKKLM